MGVVGERGCSKRCQLLMCMTLCYTFCHHFGKIHQNKAQAPLLTSRNEGNVLSVPPLEAHGMVLRVICHCWQVFYAALSGLVEHHVLWHTPGSAVTLKLFFVSCSVPKHFRPRLTEFSQCIGPRKWCLERWDWGGAVSAVAWSFTLLLSLLEWRIHVNLTSDSWSVDKQGQWKDFCFSKVVTIKYHSKDI